MTTINVAAEDGVAPEELVRADRVPWCRAELEVRTGEAAADENAAEINEQIGGFLTPALLAFAGAALLVGAFIIFNTFTITVAERTREFAMLRTLGATRGQILGAVALEALVDRRGRIRCWASCSASCSPRVLASHVRGGRARAPDRGRRAGATHDRGLAARRASA